MPNSLAHTPQVLTSEAAKILLTLFLSSLIGLEREEHKAAAGRYVFGGVRTYPLIGLLGYALALLPSADL
ncbi:MAG TPA: MgtC/SapB family protein, partial [Candidatus Acidoferrales bacterium]|nr:MgtC/SapB family protein [Candidatus Acidoferrales bacterium]